jgi:glycosyltransferase involved in cell wall biosynthesis
MDTVLVFVEYTEPSIRHVPWRLPVGGRTALGLLLERLARGCAANRRRAVLCVDERRREEVEAIAGVHDWPVIVTKAELLPAALIEFVAHDPHAGDLLLFSSRDVVPDAAASDRLLEEHRRVSAELTLAADFLLDGLVPLIVRSPALKTLSEGYRDARDVRHLASLLRWPLQSRGLQVSRVPAAELMPAADLDVLPAAPAIDDCWSHVAARDSAPVVSDNDAARIFRARLLASRDEVPALHPRPRPSAAVRSVLYASARLAFSGAENSLFALIAHLDPARYRAVAIFPVETKLAEKLREAGVEVVIAGWDYSGLTPRNLKFCEALLEAYQPDVVHVDVVPNPALMVTARARGVRLVGHVREVLDLPLPPIVTMPDRLIAVSEFLARKLRRYNMVNERVVAIHNGVGRPYTSGPPVHRDLQRCEYGIPGDAFVVSAVSRITPPKKLDVFLAGFQKVLAQEPAAWALIVGEPSSNDLAYAHELRQLARTKGVEHRTTWLPFEEDIERVFATTDVLVHCCTTEPFPRCVLEGLVFGVPAVVPDLGGATELVEDGTSGLVFAADSVDEMAFTVMRLIRDGALLERLRQQARARSRTFDVAHHVDAVQAVYDELCQPQAEPALT